MLLLALEETKTCDSPSKNELRFYDKDGKLKPSQLEKGKQLMKDAGVTFTNLVPDQGFMDYFRSAVVGFPTTFFVDKEGKVVNATCGSKDYEEWKQYVDSQLQ